MTDKRNEKPNPRRSSQDSEAAGDRPGASVKDQGEGGAGQGDEKPRRERTTEAGVVASNETKNHSQIAIDPGPGADPGKKPRKTTKGEPGSRKPGTELTKEERART